MQIVLKDDQSQDAIRYLERHLKKSRRALYHAEQRDNPDEIRNIRSNINSLECLLRVAEIVWGNVEV